MATPIRIKRSAVPGKRPAVTDLQVGELALNTYDAELVTLRDRFTLRQVLRLKLLESVQESQYQAYYM